MLESINLQSNVAVYMQIENQVQFAVASGQLKGGDQLPSFKELADRLGVNFNTVGKAYRDLEVMGYVNSRRGMGVFINNGIEAQCRQKCRQGIVSRLHEVIAEAKAAGISPAEVKEITQKCFAIESAVYGDTPPEILALAKARARRR